MLPGVLLGSGALALLQPAAQGGVEVPKVKQELQGSVLCHGEYPLLRSINTKTKQGYSGSKSTFFHSPNYYFHSVVTSESAALSTSVGVLTDKALQCLEGQALAIF